MTQLDTRRVIRTRTFRLRGNKTSLFRADIAGKPNITVGAQDLNDLPPSKTPHHSTHTSLMMKSSDPPEGSACLYRAATCEKKVEQRRVDTTSHLG